MVCIFSDGGRIAKTEIKNFTTADWKLRAEFFDRASVRQASHLQLERPRIAPREARPDAALCLTFRFFAHRLHCVHVWIDVG